MESFNKMLSKGNDEIKEVRVKNLVNGAAEASTHVIDRKRAAIRDLENKLADLTDLAPKTTDDLVSNLSKINVDDLMKDIHETICKLKTHKDLLKIMIDTHNQLFPEFPEKLDKYGEATGK